MFVFCRCPPTEGLKSKQIIRNKKTENQTENQKPCRDAFPRKENHSPKSWHQKPIVTERLALERSLVGKMTVNRKIETQTGNCAASRKIRSKKESRSDKYPTTGRLEPEQLIGNPTERLASERSLIRKNASQQED